MSTLVSARLDNILNAATELFKTKGYVGTSMRDLAEAVGLEAGSLYSHVSSKEEILQSICFGMANKFVAAIDQILSIPNCSFTEKLEMTIQAHVRIITADINATSVFWNEWQYLNDPVLSDLSNMQVEYEHKFKSVLDGGVIAGEFSISDTLFTTTAILSSLNGLQKWRSYTMPPEDLGCAFSELFISGIKR